VTSDKPTRPDPASAAQDDIDEMKLAQVMRAVPFGAAILAGSTVALLVAGYLVVYIFVFLPRGTVG
jgi:prepilin signal peptidase PulO-like enzyme (type II secretory pathway)